MNRRERDRFDALLEAVLEALPARVTALLDEAPLIVDDVPSRALRQELGLSAEDELLCGLHSGTPLTERSVEHGEGLPEMIHLFRAGIIEHAGGWSPWQDEAGRWWGGEEAIRREIRVTLLHEIGHHFGLEEDDLEELGYG